MLKKITRFSTQGGRFHYAQGLPFAVCAILWWILLSATLKAAVNVPAWDDNWWFANAYFLEKIPSFHTLFEQTNEYRQPFTRLVAWIWFQLSGFNVIGTNVISLLTLAAIWGALLSFGRKFTPWVPTWVSACFLMFMLSPIGSELYELGCNSSFLLATLFFVLAVFFLFDRGPSKIKFALGVISAVLCPLSLSTSGSTFSVGFILGYSLFYFQKIRKSKKSPDRKRAGLFFALPVLAVLAVIVPILVTFVKPGGQPPWTFPDQPLFWEHYLNSIAFGFGYNQLSVFIGVLSLSLILFPLLVLFKHFKYDPPDAVWAIFTLVLGSFVVLFSISIGRSGYGAIQAKASRYFTYESTFIPATLYAWGCYFHYLKKSRQSSAVFAAIWGFCFCGFYPHWDYVRPFEHVREYRLKGLECLRRFYEGSGPGYCPDLAPADLTQQLEWARTMNLSIYRDNLRSATHPD